MPAEKSECFVVAGTDTGVGKTFVGAALLRVFRAEQTTVIGIKPVESGCGGDAPEDGVLLAGASAQRSPIAALTRLLKPVAPPLAAKEEGVVLDYDEWCSAIFEAQEEAHVLIEGAGGLMSPLTDSHTLLDLAEEFDAKVLVVGLDRLGTLNHVLLTVSMIESAGLDVLGVVLVTPEAEDASSGTNAGMLEDFGLDLPVAVLPRCATDEEADGHIAPVAEWFGL